MLRNPRYENKPFLRILECYVMDTIGELSPEDENRLEAMTPKLRAIYNAEGDWRSVVRHAMEFSPGLDQRLKDLWARNQEIAAQHDQILSAELS